MQLALYLHRQSDQSHFATHRIFTYYAIISIWLIEASLLMEWGLLEEKWEGLIGLQAPHAFVRGSL